MKKLLVIASIAITAIAAQAQSRQPATLLNPGNVTTSGTSNYTAAVVVNTADYCGIGISFKLDGAGTDPLLFKFAKSVDGTTFESTPSVTVSVSANGTSTVNAFSSATVQGAWALRLAQIVGSTNANATNIVVKAFPKSFLR